MTALLPNCCLVEFLTPEQMKNYRAGGFLQGLENFKDRILERLKDSHEEKAKWESIRVSHQKTHGGNGSFYQAIRF